MLKVTMIVGSFPEMPCGVGDYTYRLVEALLRVDEGVKVDVVTSADSRVKVSSHARLVVHQVSNWGVRGLFSLMRMAARSGADVVHIQYPTKGYGTGLAPNLLPLFWYFYRPRMSVVVTLHEFTIAHPLRKLSTVFLILAPRRLVVCDLREEKALRHFRWPRGRPELIPLGANIPVWFKCHPQVREGDHLTLCHFGFLNKSKEGFLCVEALCRLWREGLPSKLVFVGGIKPEEEARLRALAAEKRVADLVSFTGFCPTDEVSRHLAQADIALFPFRDGISLRRGSFVAAMQHGLAVVTTRARDYLPPGLQDGENVLLAPVGDWEAFLQAVRRIASDSELRLRLGTNAKRWGAAFTWEAIARRHIALYRELVGVRVKGDGPK
ncbi:glycosyl transferase, group 1 [Candidatus Desulforudis audaxviator]|nr:glycosyl transferase, group 1 [Candidatus Desulforudis audaxviator]